MKQLDLIICLTVLVIAGVATGVLVGTQPKVPSPAAADKPVLTPVALPEAAPTYSNSLPGGSGGVGIGGGGRGGGKSGRATG